MTQLIEELLPAREEILRRFEGAGGLTTPSAPIEIVRLDPPLKGQDLRRTDRSKFIDINPYGRLKLI